jgi:hypothetical protein
MIFCQAMGKIRHGGGCHTVPFWRLCGMAEFLGDRAKQKNSQFLCFSFFVASSRNGLGASAQAHCAPLKLF